MKISIWAAVPKALSPGVRHSLNLSRLLPVASGWEAEGLDLVASPLVVAPECFPGNVGYLWSDTRGLS